MKPTPITLLALALLLSLGGAPAYAQQFRTAVGGRVGDPSGFSVKHFLDDAIAVEGVAAASPFGSYRYFGVEGLGLYHFNDVDFGADLETMRLYAGVGAGVRFFDYDRSLFGVGVDPDDFSGTALNVKALVGLQYVFEDAPLELTLDGGPRIYAGRNLFGGLGVFGVHYSLGVRYILSR